MKNLEKKERKFNGPLGIKPPHAPSCSFSPFSTLFLSPLLPQYPGFLSDTILILTLVRLFARFRFTSPFATDFTRFPSPLQFLTREEILGVSDG